jgi:hypothetical protein
MHILPQRRSVQLRYFVSTAALTSADDGPRDSTYGKGSNAPLSTFLASRFALVYSCAHPLTGPPDRI